MADLETVMDFAERCGAAVIEDAAQALGARWRGKSVGSIGDAGFYSLAVGKGLTLYEGGVLTAHDPSLRAAMTEVSKAIAPYRRKWEIRRLLELAAYAALYRPATLGFVYGMPLRRALKRGNAIEAVGDDFSADIPLHEVGTWRKAIGANALTRLPSFLDALTAQAVRRKQRLAAISGVTLMEDNRNGIGVWPFFMVLMPDVQTRDAALSFLWPAGLGVSRLFVHALPDYPYLASTIGTVNVPHARDFAARMLTVSNSSWMREEEFSLICETLERCAVSARQQRKQF